MKKVLYNNITSGVNQPLTAMTLQQLQEANTDTWKAYAGAIHGVMGIGKYVIFGLDNTGASGSPAIQPGALYYNGEIYLLTTSVATTGTAYVHVVTTYRTGDPLTFSDGNQYNVHEVNEITISNVAAGALCAYSALIRANQILRKYVAIGNWDMDTDENKIVDHADYDINDFSKIISVTGVIHRDDGIANYPIPGADDPLTSPQVAVYAISAGGIILIRKTGGKFDDAQYSTTPFNRGYLLIDYMAG